MQYTVIAQRGQQYLLIESGVDPQDARAKGRILDVSQGRLFPALSVQSVLARGYWEEYTGPQAALPRLLAQVEDAENRL